MKGVSKHVMLLQCAIVLCNGLGMTLKAGSMAPQATIVPLSALHRTNAATGFTAFLEMGQHMKSTAPKKKMDSIQGRIDLNGVMSDVDCDCTDKWRTSLDKSVSQCLTPNKFRIQRIDTLGSVSDDDPNMSPKEVRDFLGLPSALKYVEIGGTPLHDIDGRATAKVLGVPGGDAGEFIGAVQVYCDILEIVPTKKQMREWFEKYLGHIAPRKFYMHSSADAVDSLQLELGLEGLDVSSPKSEPATLKPSLLGECQKNRAPPCGLMSPNNLGDAHLKLMLLSPGKYMVDEETIHSFLAVFYAELWDGDESIKKQLEFEVLSAAKLRNERALLNIMVSEKCRDEKRVPLIKVRGPEQAIFVNHPAAGDARRQELASFFASMSSDLVPYEEMLSRLQTHSAHAFDATAKKMAKGLPVYNVIIE